MFRHFPGARIIEVRKLARPLYESPADLKNEESVLSVICEKWKSEAAKLPIKYGVDYMLLRSGDAVASCEIKCRTNPMEQYPDYMISLGKLIDAKAIRDLTGIPFLLIIRWTDKIGYWRLPDDPKVITRMGGRTDRNDSQDVEPCAFIPIQDFAVLNNANSEG